MLIINGIKINFQFAILLKKKRIYQFNFIYIHNFTNYFITIKLNRER